MSPRSVGVPFRCLYLPYSYRLSEADSYATATLNSWQLLRATPDDDDDISYSAGTHLLLLIISDAVMVVVDVVVVVNCKCLTKRVI